MLGILRVPPVNSTEDSLQISVQQIIRSMIPIIAPTKGQLEFIQSVSNVLQKSCLPFLSEISDVAIRKSLILSTLSLLQSLLPLHGSSTSPDTTLLVLTKFQQEPGPTSLISLLHHLLDSTDDSSLIESVMNTLTIITDHPQLTVTLDIKTSPICQNMISDSIRLIITKLMPFINPGTFLYKSCARTCLQLLSRIPELVKLDSFMWCIRLTEDRDAIVRQLAWGFLSMKSIECYQLHSSVLDIALEVVFGLGECYGVKIHVAKFLCAITDEIINSEGHSCKDAIIRAMFQYAVISHIKNMLYENSGPPPCYFAILISLLNNLLIIETKKVLGICIQIDI